MRKILLTLILGSILISSVFALQMDELELRPSATLRFSPLNDLKLYITPEVRLDYFTADKFMLEVKAKYSLNKYLDAGAAYKLVLNQRNNDPLEVIHRVDVFAEGEYKIERFIPSLRLMYVNYDEDEGVSHFLRYKIKVDYNIPKSKIDPFLAAELYHQLIDASLYKMRYSIGADWRFAKKHSIGLAYKLDDYLADTRLKHIVALGYTYKF